MSQSGIKTETTKASHSNVYQRWLAIKSYKYGTLISQL